MLHIALITHLAIAAGLSAAAPQSVKPLARTAADTAKTTVPVTSPEAAAPAPTSKALPSGNQAGAKSKQDSLEAKVYRISARPFDNQEMKSFLAAFDMKDVGKPDSNAVNRVYRDKGGAVLAYEPDISEVGFVNGKVPVLGPDDFIPDSLIRTKTDPMIRKLLKDRADRYVFANYEATYIQSRIGKDAKEIGPAVPAFYIGRYIRKIDERIVLGDAFQIRLGYGKGGGIQAFSFRDPVLTQAGTVTVPKRKTIIDSLARWTKSRTRTKRLTYPFHADKPRVLALKPLRVVESYVEVQEKDGLFIKPSVTVLAQATLEAPTRKQSEPVPPDPVILHFHFPCRSGAGLCWPDHGGDIPATASAPAAPRPALRVAPGNRPDQIKRPIPPSAAPAPR